MVSIGPYKYHHAAFADMRFGTKGVNHYADVQIIISTVVRYIYYGSHAVVTGA
jgi:hypothetical protein